MTQETYENFVSYDWGNDEAFKVPDSLADSSFSFWAGWTSHNS